jgi:glycosyltransferase involved in cell wall biosynthesis
MKIVIASGIYPPDIGGPATYSQLIAREFIKRGIDVSVICYSDKKDEFTDQQESFKIKRIPRKRNVLFRYWIYFWNLLKLAKDTDVIYAQGPLAAGFPAIWVSRILKKKFVIKIVGDYAWEQYQNQKSKIKNQKSKIDDIETFQKNKYDFLTELRKKIQKMAVNKADKIIVPSEFLKKIVFEWGVNPEKIFVVYNSPTDVKNIKGDLKIGGDVIISGGRLEPWKGMSALIEIMPDLLKENSNFRLVIVGYGPERNKLKIKIKDLKLENEVRLIDRLPHREFLEYFKASKIFVLNSGYEGFSHLLLEAMAIGLPIITTNVCGNPEIIKDGYNGLLVEYNNKTQFKEAILRVWKNKDLQNKFSENGEKTVLEFSLERMLNETIKILTS